MPLIARHPLGLLDTAETKRKRRSGALPSNKVIWMCPRCYHRHTLRAELDEVICCDGCGEWFQVRYVKGAL
ncbi:MAG: hypothetical protein PHI12_13095 [Dehalococcoidales bacterium]|nr:hypothetical protein [Dehalococcoidales bacterium]